MLVVFDFLVLNLVEQFSEMVDSREINNVDGTVQQRQRKQMEVYQSQVPGGSMQVVRTQTVTTSSSSSSSKRNELFFGDLELPVNHLDLSSEKRRVTVGRSGSIGSRRPPSRPRSFIERAKIFSDETSQSFFKPPSFFTNSSHVNGDDPDSQVTIEEITDEKPHHTTLRREKSNSTENLHTETSDISRSSKVRRSLQFPKQSEVYENQEDVDLSNLPLRERAARIESLLRDNRSWAYPSEKRTVTSIRKESFREENNSETKVNEDDGIVTETSPSNMNTDTFRADKRINGTGSLESRTTKNLTSLNRSDEWYNRRKSYGFESVEKQEKATILNKTSHIDSSTDSGICRSSEVINSVPSWVKIVEQRNALNERNGKDPATITPKTTTQTNGDFKSSDFTNNWNNLNNVLKTNQTSITIAAKNRYPNSNGLPESNQKHSYVLGSDLNNDTEIAWNRKSPLPAQKNYMRENLKTSLKSAKNPWISQLSGTKLAEKIWNTEEWWEKEDKKGEGLNGVVNNHEDNKENGVKTDEEDAIQKKKRVEFSKTEVHFAAESGRLNIVETENKPPSNNIFRRRRKSNPPAASAPVEPSLPTLKFGETPQEKEVLSPPKRKDNISEKIEAELHELSKLVSQTLPNLDEREHEEFTFKNATILPKLHETDDFHPNVEKLDEHKPRSILKNFRKSYLLGEVPEVVTAKTESKPAPIWKSTVVLRNSNYGKKLDSKQCSSDGEAEFQACLRKIKRSDESKETHPTADELKRRSIPDDSLLNSYATLNDEPVQVIIDDRPLLSVAERVKQVEELKAKNYSTKINFTAGETRVIKEPEEPVTNKIWIPPASSTSQTYTPPTYRPQNQEQTSNKRESFFTKPTEISEPTSRAWMRQRQPSSDESTTWKNSVNDNKHLNFSFSESSKKREELMSRAETLFESSKKKDGLESKEVFQSKKKNEAIPADHFSDSKKKEEPVYRTNFLSESYNRRNIRQPGGSSVNSSDSKTSFNPVVSRSLASESNHKKSGVDNNSLKTRISINYIQPKSNGLECPKSTPQATNSDEVMKPSKPVFEMVSRFNNLSKLPPKGSKDKERRRTVPINFKARTREYTQADLEEELKNFTENLDKDFKNIYEEEIESLRAKSKLSNSKQNLHIDKCIEELGKQNQKTYTYDSDDSDVAADHEVRSYMSTGHDTDSDDEKKIFKRWDKQSAFKNLQEQIKRLEIAKKYSDAKKTTYTSITSLGVVPKKTSQPNVASIALRYEDDPLFTKITPSGSMSSIDSNGNRQRSSYLNCPSLSEKYSKLLRTVPEPRRVYSDDAASDQVLSTRRYSDISLDRLSDITPNRDLSRRNYALPARPSFLQEKTLSESRKKISAIRAKLEGSLSDLNGSDRGSLDDQLLSSDDDRKGRTVISNGRHLDTISEGKKLLHTSKGHVCKKYNSSVSSLDSLVGTQLKEPNKTVSKTRVSSKVSSRCERLSQRASSREAILNMQHSSSEDISASEVLSGKRYRKTRSNIIQDGTRRVKAERKPSIKEEKTVKSEEKERKSETKRVAKVHRTRSSEMRQRSKTDTVSSRGSTQKTDADQSRPQKIAERTKEMKISTTKTSQLRESSRQKSSTQDGFTKSKSSSKSFNRFTR